LERQLHPLSVQLVPFPLPPRLLIPVSLSLAAPAAVRFLFLLTVSPARVR
jgi:hypothetical protein